MQGTLGRVVVLVSTRSLVVTSATLIGVQVAVPGWFPPGHGNGPTQRRTNSKIHLMSQKRDSQEGTLTSFVELPEEPLGTDGLRGRRRVCRLRGYDAVTCKRKSTTIEQVPWFALATQELSPIPVN